MIVGLLVLSHWILDLPMHRPDLPLWPGSSTKVGLGAWGSIWALCSMVAVLLLIFFSGFFSPPPPNERALAYTALGIWLFVPWGYWIDRHRDVVEADPSLRSG